MAGNLTGGKPSKPRKASNSGGLKVVGDGKPSKPRHANPPLKGKLPKAPIGVIRDDKLRMKKKPPVVGPNGRGMKAV